MRLFISEAVCGGGWPDPLTETVQGQPRLSSLAQEGRSMLTALLADATRIPGCDVCTTWDPRLGPGPGPPVRVHTPAGHDDASSTFRQLAAEADWTLVVAPEFGGLLANRLALVADVGGRAFAATVDAARLCSDKLALAEFLTQRGVSTIPTCPLEWDDDAETWTFPAVVKPRDGAGSTHVRLVRSAVEWRSRRAELQQQFGALAPLRQPFVPGPAISVGLLFDVSRRLREVLPVCTQELAADGTFAYRGGRVPADLPAAARRQIHAWAERVADTVPGLVGYVGLDLIWCSGPPGESDARAAGSGPCLVEINPRLTTSYLGYQALCADNLLAIGLGCAPTSGRLRWHPGGRQYAPEGRVTIL